MERMASMIIIALGGWYKDIINIIGVVNRETINEILFAFWSVDSILHLDIEVCYKI
ncbi:MAG: hypothetical protein ACM3MK_06990 [Chitinophagales bacterium]